MEPLRRLTSVSGPFAAHLLAARLGSEGIDVQLRGNVDGPYVLTVGDIARVDVFVPDEQLDDAHLVLLAADVDDVMAAPREWGGETPRRHWILWVALVVIAVAGVAPLLRQILD